MAGELTHERWMEAIGRLAADALGCYDLPEGCRVTMINHSENTTFRVDAPDGGRWALRVHREAYHTRTAIRSELAWMEALRQEADVRTPTPVPGKDGEVIQEAESDVLGKPRHCVLFEWLLGSEPDESELLAPFEQLGEITGRMHRHARSWRRPPWFERLTWDYGTTLGDQGHWGRWQDGFALTLDRIRLLERLSATIRKRLDAFGKSESRFGLVHADNRLANVLVHDGLIQVIDFDDCGFSWYLYDCATALSFIEDRHDVPQLIEAWVRGYRRVVELSAEEEAEIPSFVMLRRLLLVAWIGSHAETELAQEMGDHFTAVTCDLAEPYLARFG
jgi:Ser/Thr protein kinase RdoA (MazF antagonist)